MSQKETGIGQNEGKKRKERCSRSRFFFSLSYTCSFSLFSFSIPLSASPCMGRSLLKSQLERLSALEPKPSKTSAVSKKTDRSSKSNKNKSKAKKKKIPPPPPTTTTNAADDAEKAALGYFRATLTSKASEKAREVMSRALGL